MKLWFRNVYHCFLKGLLSNTCCIQVKKLTFSHEEVLTKLS